ncbi:cap-gly domain-containing protein [Candida albicans]|nr:hypothetical protein MGO_05569 [Candida albicans P76055]
MSDLNIFITSNLTSSERRISPQWNLKYLKQKLESITGISPQNQILHYYPNNHSNEYKLIPPTNGSTTTDDDDDDEQILLSSLNLQSYSRIHVIDSDPNSDVNKLQQQHQQHQKEEEEEEKSEIEEGDVAGFTEFQLSEEDYKTRQNSVLNWKKINKLGRFDPQFQSLQEKLHHETEMKLKTMSIGSRCRLINIENNERRGIIRFIGKIMPLDNGENDWVGIEFDEPVGKNNGSIDGVKIFECKPNHGSFVRPRLVEVGDFPELDPFADDDDDDDDEDMDDDEEL